jgi:hypothetical protein
LNKTVEKLEIRWPDGGTQRLMNVTADRVLEVVESTGP